MLKNSQISSKSATVTLLLFILFCYLGLHRFYVGKIKSGLYILLLEIIGIFFISLKIIIIAKYYANVNYGNYYYYFNLIGLIGYICFIVVILSLFPEIIALFSGEYLDAKGRKVIFK